MSADQVPLTDDRLSTQAQRTGKDEAKTTATTATAAIITSSPSTKKIQTGPNCASNRINGARLLPLRSAPHRHFSGHLWPMPAQTARGGPDPGLASEPVAVAVAGANRLLLLDLQAQNIDRGVAEDLFQPGPGSMLPTRFSASLDTLEPRPGTGTGTGTGVAHRSWDWDAL
ncbi:hypothetical protein MMC30_004718 [Trapelia coarctata]|nr:hypothetical protein [Trapelia coarctata]